MRGVFGTRTADEVNAGGERAAESRARRRDAISVAIGQEPVMVQPPRIMPESRGFPALGGFVGEYDGADAVFT